MFTQNDALASIVGADAQHIIKRVTMERDATIAEMVALIGKATDDCLKTMVRWTRDDAADGSERSAWVLPYLETELANRGLTVPRIRSVK